MNGIGKENQKYNMEYPMTNYASGQVDHNWGCDCSKCGYEAVEDVHEAYLDGNLSKFEANFKLEQIAQGYEITDFPKLPKKK